MNRPLTADEKQQIENLPAEWGAITQLARQLGRPTNSLSNYLRTLGRPPKSRPWTREEDQILIEYQGESIRGLHKKLQEMGFSRSLGAIGERKQKLRLIVHPDLNGDYSAQALAQGLGSSTTTVTAWIRRGWLRAHRPAGHELRGGATWVITPNAVRNFLIDYTAHVDFARADKYFLTDILTGSGREKAAAQETA